MHRKPLSGLALLGGLPTRNPEIALMEGLRRLEGPKESPDRSRGIEATPWAPLERGSQFAGGSIL